MSENRMFTHVDEFLAEFYHEITYTEASPLIYHYTTMEGIKGIITSKSLWLTESSFLNDPEEVRHGITLSRINILQKALEIVKNNNGNIQIENILKMLDQKCNQECLIDHKSIFITSFCENGDLLSQWKGYSAFGKGYSISLSHDSLVNVDDFIVGKVIYDNEKQVEIINNFLKCIYKDEKDIKNIGVESYIELLFGVIQLISTFFKKSYFSEENEWRLVRHFGVDENPEIKYRTSENGLIPYIEYSFDEYSNIEKIIVGPKLDFLNNRKAISYYVDKNKIEKSSINIQ